MAARPMQRRDKLDGVCAIFALACRESSEQLRSLLALFCRGSLCLTCLFTFFKSDVIEMDLNNYLYRSAVSSLFIWKNLERPLAVTRILTRRLWHWQLADSKKNLSKTSIVILRFYEIYPLMKPFIQKPPKARFSLLCLRYWK